MKVLCIFEQCNPLWASVPLVAFNLYRHIRDLADVTLVTHARNRDGLEPVRRDHRIFYIKESGFIRSYYRLVSRPASGGGVIWPLKHALTYPAYAEFNRRVLAEFGHSVARGDYDIVHAFTPVLPRYPFAIARECRTTPFILGPVNGGIPYPAGFQHIARREFSGLNVLRLFCRLLPGYARSYTVASRVLAGSGYTGDMIRGMFGLSRERLIPFPENGIDEQRLQPEDRTRRDHVLRLLFTGRLVPYKGADMLLDAMSMLPESVRENCRLTILGDGPERARLQEQAARLGLSSCVAFAGWVEQKDTTAYYRQADLFCFPSVREFGGAVVLEAMACGLPCIVVDHGGIAEYTTPETGFKIAPVSRAAVVAELAACIERLFNDRGLRERMAQAALQQSRSFCWPAKARQLLNIYTQALRDAKDISS